MDKLVDFSQPVEAIRGDGAAFQAKAFHRDGDKPDVFFVSVEGQFGWPFHNTGRPLYENDMSGRWTVRNTAKPSTPSNEELTQRMEIERELYIRMEAFIQRWSEETITNLLQSSQVKEQAKALKADLPKPVDSIDPDIRHAREIAITFNSGARIAEEIISGKRDEEESVKALVKAIKLGRTLAAGGTLHMPPADGDA